MANTKQPRLLSGVKPTGRPHIGNFFGAMKQFVDLQTDYRALIMIADYHALTTVHKAEILRQDILDLAIDYLAIGLDPAKVTLFRQSAVTEHTELAWIFNCITTVPYLMRAHAYKDARAKGQEVSVGTFAYPMLMAADILMYDPDVVPVGQDQKQHAEYSRDTAEKFNRLFGQTFKLPEPLIMEQVKTIPGLDGQKMSKSYNNHIPLFVKETELKQLIMKIVTDSKSPTEPKNPDTCNIFALYRLVADQTEQAELAAQYQQGQISYQAAKELLFDKLNTFLAPLREARAEMASRPKAVLEIISSGNEQARQIAEDKMEMVREKIGIKL